MPRIKVLPVKFLIIPKSHQKKRDQKGVQDVLIMSSTWLVNKKRKAPSQCCFEAKKKPNQNQTRVNLFSFCAPDEAHLNVIIGHEWRSQTGSKQRFAHLLRACWRDPQEKKVKASKKPEKEKALKNRVERIEI